MPTLFLQAQLPTAEIIILVVIVLILLLLSGVVAAAETAFFSLSAKDVNYLKVKDSDNARQATRLLDRPRQLLATLMIARYVFSIAIIIGIHLLARLILPASMNFALRFGLQAVIITLVLLWLGNILPKVYAAHNYAHFVLGSAPFVNFIHTLYRPLSLRLVSNNTLAENRNFSRQNNEISQEEFEQTIEQTVGHSATVEEVEIFKSIMKFGNITARQVMRSRQDIRAIHHELSLPLIKQYAMEVGHSRMPVYKNNLDDIVGVLYTKDLLPYSEEPDFDWHSLIRPAFFVPEGKYIEDLLRDFQKKRMHFAIVVDEYGGTAGVLTMEDVMEEIIGDINDEFDEVELQYKKIDDSSYIFSGKTLINDLCRITGIDQHTFSGLTEKNSSLAGLVLEINGKFPAINETIGYKDVTMTILDLAGNRIEKVKVVLPQLIKDAEGIS